MRILGLVVSLVVMSACVDPDEPELSETSQEVTWTIVTYRDCITQGCNHVVVGNAADQTCFLAGVTGHIARAPNLGGGQVAVYIDSGTNQWKLYADTTIRAVGVTCISDVANRVFGVAHNSTEVIPGPTSPQRQCFLSNVIWGTNNPAFGDSSSTFKLFNNWYVSTSMVNGGDTSAWAVCVDVGVKLGTWSFSHDVAGSTTKSLATVQNSGACGLVSLNGFAGANTPYPSVRVNSFTPTVWAWAFDEHVGAAAACVQPF